MGFTVNREFVESNGLGCPDKQEFDALKFGKFEAMVRLFFLPSLLAFLPSLTFSPLTFSSFLPSWVFLLLFLALSGIKGTLHDNVRGFP
jgi:hypothetical protein